MFPYGRECVPAWCRMPWCDHQIAGGCWGISSGEQGEKGEDHCRPCELYRWASGLCSKHQEPAPLCPTCNPEISRLEAEVKRLRDRLREQTAQTQCTARQIHAEVVSALKRRDAIPAGHNEYGHPIEQTVATCISVLQGKVEGLEAKLLDVAEFARSYDVREDGEDGHENCPECEVFSQIADKAAEAAKGEPDA